MIRRIASWGLVCQLAACAPGVLDIDDGDDGSQEPDGDPQQEPSDGDEPGDPDEARSWCIVDWTYDEAVDGVVETMSTTEWSPDGSWSVTDSDWDADGTWDFWEEDLYDDDGRLESSETITDEVRYLTTYFYEGAELVESRMEIWFDGEFLYEYVYDYLYEDGVLSAIEGWVYGQLVYVADYQADALGRIDHVEVDWDGDGLVDATYTYEYDGDDIVRQEIDETVDGIPDYVEDYVYEDGLLVTTAVDDDADGVTDTEAIHHYDADDRPSEQITDVGVDGVDDALQTWAYQDCVDP